MKELDAAAVVLRVEQSRKTLRRGLRIDRMLEYEDDETRQSVRLLVWQADTNVHACGDLFVEIDQPFHVRINRIGGSRAWGRLVVQVGRWTSGQRLAYGIARGRKGTAKRSVADGHQFIRHQLRVQGSGLHGGPASHRRKFRSDRQRLTCFDRRLWTRIGILRFE